MSSSRYLITTLLVSGALVVGGCATEPEPAEPEVRDPGPAPSQLPDLVDGPEPAQQQQQQQQARDERGARPC